MLKETRSSLTPCSSCKKGKRAVERRILEIIPHFSATQVEILEDTIKHFQGVGGKFNPISDASGTRLLKSLFTSYGLKSIWEKVDQFAAIHSLEEKYQSLFGKVNCSLKV